MRLGWSLTKTSLDKLFRRWHVVVVFFCCSPSAVVNICFSKLFEKKKKWLEHAFTEMLQFPDVTSAFCESCIMLKTMFTRKVAKPWRVELSLLYAAAACEGKAADLSTHMFAWPSSRGRAIISAGVMWSVRKCCQSSWNHPTAGWCLLTRWTGGGWVWVWGRGRAVEDGVMMSRLLTCRTPPSPTWSSGPWVRRVILTEERCIVFRAGGRSRPLGNRAEDDNRKPHKSRTNFT